MVADGSVNPGLKAFRDAAYSLKLYRRAELQAQDGTELIKELYVDPLPNDHVLETMLQAHTTFLIGRKGTGKSTVFQRAQYALRERSDVATCYVDIKSVYESSRVDREALSSTNSYDGVLSSEAIERFWLNRDFFLAIITSIREELEKKISNSGKIDKFLNRAKFSSIKDLFKELDELIDKTNTEQFESVLGAAVRSKKSASENSLRNVASVEGSSTAGTSGLKSEASAHLSNEATSKGSVELEQTDVLLRVFDFRKMIKYLRSALEACGVKSLYIFLDDFSELPEPAMQVVVDALISPLNNWSDELIKFKIAAYPGRIYYGEIDRAKVDEVNLDLYSLYGTADLVAMEQKAVEFTRRLVSRRLEHFGASDLSLYFDSSSDDFWRQLFHASMANPRILGYLLYFAYEESLIYGHKIGTGTIRDVSKKYFEDKIQASFDMNRFLSESFEERSSIFSLKDLLDKIIGRARALRKSDSTVFRGLESRAPTSHFHVDSQMESLLGSLELNFFITKYFLMSDKDGRKVTVYAINYGLCQQQVIEFGRPTGTREQRFRQYYVERVFDYTPILSSYVRQHQEIVCSACDARHEFDLLPALKTFGMLCPTCHQGKCRVINLSREYESSIREVDEASLLPKVELDILHSLKTETQPLTASDVADDLGWSYQLIGKKVKYLSERYLVNRDQHDERGRRVYVTTELADSIYFDGRNNSADVSQQEMEGPVPGVDAGKDSGFEDMG